VATYKKGSGKRTGRAILRKLAVFEFLFGKRHPVTLKDLMAEFRVSDDTMRRDIADLEAAGFGIDAQYDSDDQNRVLYKLKNRAYVETAITRGEVHSAASSLRHWSPYRGTPFYSDMSAMITKVIECLPEGERKDIERDHGHCYFVPDGGTKDYEKHWLTIKAFQRAVTHQRRVKYRYWPIAKKKPRSGVMEPHGIVYYRNTVYVLGRCIQSKRQQKKGATQRLEWVKWPAERFDQVGCSSRFRPEIRRDLAGLIV
jgi:predicted DNA-binding transcriptional regulator YafY